MRWTSPALSGHPGLWGLGSESPLALGAELVVCGMRMVMWREGFEVLKEVDGEIFRRMAVGVWH